MIEPTDKIGNITLYNADCMEVMKTFKDKQFDLAIVDPPYGIGAGEGVGATRGISFKKYKKKKWDSKPPDKEYFDELFRVSKNQIIFGGNYFTDKIPVSRGWIYWKKMIGGNYADGELAWTSFDMNLKEFTKRSEQGKLRFHPTQKPVALYTWLLNNYAKEGDTILDTHFGSLSIGIACEKLGFELTAIELDKDYYQMAKKRLLNFKKQLTIEF